MKTETRYVWTEEMSNAEYHAHDAVGASMLEDFIESRALYHAKHIAKTIPPSEPSPAMQLGTLLHKRVLEPDRFAAEVAEPMPDYHLMPQNVTAKGEPTTSKNTKHYKAQVEAYHNANQGKIIPTHAQMAMLDEMDLSLRLHHGINRLFRQEGCAEFSIFWKCPHSGVTCKCRVDWFAPISVDLKTTAKANPMDFARQANNLGYYRKHEHYLNGIALYLESVGSTIDPVMFYAAVQTEAPYQAALYRLEPLEDGPINLPHAQRIKALRELAECYRTDHWSDWWSEDVVTLRQPRYAANEQEYKL